MELFLVLQIILLFFSSLLRSYINKQLNTSQLKQTLNRY